MRRIEAVKLRARLAIIVWQAYDTIVREALTARRYCWLRRASRRAKQVHVRSGCVMTWYARA